MPCLSSDKDLAIKLRDWCIRSNVPPTAVTDLLHILHPYHTGLPLDYKALMKTASVSTVIKKMNK